jgi:hypothetical protein
MPAFSTGLVRRRVREERHVGHDERPLRAANDGLRVVDHLGHRHADRGLVAEDHLAERVAHEEHRDARFVEQLRRRVVVRGEHRDAGAVGVEARDVVDGGSADGIGCGAHAGSLAGSVEAPVCAARSRSSSRRTTRSNSASATARFDWIGRSSRDPSEARIVTRFVSVPKPEPASLTSFATRRSTPFSRQLVRGPVERASLGREPHEDRSRSHGPFGDLAGDPCQQVGRRLEPEREPVAPRELHVAGLDGSEVRDRGGHDQPIEAGRPVAVPEGGGERRLEVGSRFDPDEVRLWRQRDLDVRRDQRHPGAAIERGLGDGDAHLPGRPVADEPHRVDRLAGAPGADDDVPPLEVGLADPSVDDRWTLAGFGHPDRPVADGRDHGIDDRADLGQATDAGLPGRQRTRLRLDDGIPEGAQPIDVGDGRGVGPHVPSIAGATTTGAAVARQAALTTSPDRPLAIAPSQCAVAGATTIASALSPMTMCPIRPSGAGRGRRSRPDGATRAANERGPTKWGRGGGLHHGDVAPSARRARKQLDGLVRGDRAGDAETDEASFEATAHLKPSSSGSPPPTSAWRIARPLSVSSGSMASTPSSDFAHGCRRQPAREDRVTSSGRTPLASRARHGPRRSRPVASAW